MAVSVQTPRRTPQVLPRGSHDLGDLPHAGDCIGDVRFAGQRGLGQKQEHAVAYVIAVDPRVLLERMQMGRLPKRGFQVVLEDLVVDLPGPRQPFAVDLLGEQFQRLAGVRDPALSGAGREIVQQAVETMVAQPRGLQRAEAERLVEVLPEERLQVPVRILPHHELRYQAEHSGNNGHGSGESGFHGKNIDLSTTLASSPGRWQIGG